MPFLPSVTLLPSSSSLFYVPGVRLQEHGAVGTSGVVVPGLADWEREIAREFVWRTILEATA